MEVHMETLFDLRLSVFHLMVAAAKDHKNLTGVQISAFHVPPFVMAKLKAGKNWQQSANEGVGYVGEFAFFEGSTDGIYMYEKGCTFPYEVLS
jgi:hypothetical protein